MNTLFVAKIPTLEFGSTWRARMESRFRKARARCWDTCFLLLANMTSRHCSTIPISSLVAPQKQNFIQRVNNHVMDIQLDNLLRAGHWKLRTTWKLGGSDTSHDSDIKHPPFFDQNSPALNRKNAPLFLCSFLRKDLFHQKCLNMKHSYCFNPKCMNCIIFYKLLNSAKI